MADKAVRTETALADFDHLLDTDSLVPVFETHLAERLLAGDHIVVLVVSSVRYRTYGEVSRYNKSSITVTYKVSVASDREPGERDVELYFRGFLGGRSSIKHNPKGASVLVPELDGYAWTVSSDQLMPALGSLHHPRDIISSLPPALRVRAPGKPVTAKSVVIRYKPEDRCTTRVVVTQDITTTLYAKTFASSERGEQLAMLGNELSRASDRGGGRFLVPRVHSFDEARSTLWLYELAGSEVTAEMLVGPLTEQIADAMLGFHDSGMVVDKIRDPADLLAEATRKSDRLKNAIPALDPMLSALIEHSKAQSPDFGEIDRRLVHGAYRLRQLRVQHGCVGILDFDSVSMGDPAEDVADLVADIAVVTNDHTASNPIVQRFLATYGSASRSAAIVERVRWHLPLQLLKRAYWMRGRANTASETETASEIWRRVERACLAAGIPWDR